MHEGETNVLVHARSLNVMVAFICLVIFYFLAISLKRFFFFLFVFLFLHFFSSRCLFRIGLGLLPVISVLFSFWSLSVTHLVIVLLETGQKLAQCVFVRFISGDEVDFNESSLFRLLFDEVVGLKDSQLCFLMHLL